MKAIRLASRHNFREVEKEWQWEFVFLVLEEIGIPEDELSTCLPDDGDLSKIDVQHRIALRNLSHKRDIRIIDDHDGGLKIYVYVQELEDFVLIASWGKCRFVYREDPYEIDPDQKIYVEVHADLWAVFEDQEEENE